jgi:aminopeptidase N
MVTSLRKFVSTGAVIASLCVACADTTSVQAPATVDVGPPPTFRLPDGARPLRYDLALTIVPGEGRARGTITIDIELARPHPVLWLNAASTLTIVSASVDVPETRVDVLPGNDQFAGFVFDPPLAAGKHRLTIVFSAEQVQNAARGIFIAQEAGATYAMTHFEPLAARRAFPCFDEPGFKVPWRLTLRVPRDLVAVSNTPIENEIVGDDGLKTVRFAETRPLPSYLVAFAVGPWEFRDAGTIGSHSTPMRIVVPRGRLADSDFVARAYPELFGEIEQWFGIAYPYRKLDHITIPLGVSFAMENVGLITYGAPALLARPDAVTARYRRGAANVGAHEMAHQWFGNLVTTAWWDDIWLNEAFATWFAAKMVDRWRPDYDRGAARIEERADAIDADSLASARQIRQPVNERGDIFNAFDAITYQKGATVIGMFEGWIGEDAFRRGVQAYLESRRDGSATAEDFLKSMTEATGKPVTSAFDTFLNQNGVPQIEVNLRCTRSSATLELAQHRLTLLGATQDKSQRWQIPVCARYGRGASSRQACTLMTESKATLSLEGGCPTYVFANAGGRGYYVPDYRGDLLARLAAHRDTLTVSEYASLVGDLRALLRTGSVSVAQATEWLRKAGRAKDRHVVVAAIELGEFLRNELVTDANRAKFSAVAREVFGPRARALGFAPKLGESDDDALLRRSLLRFVGREDPALAAQARTLALAWVRDRKAVDPGMVDAVLMVAAQTGDAAMFNALLAEAKATTDLLDRRNLLSALFSFSDPALAQRGMAMLLDSSFDPRESWTALRYSFYADPTRPETNAFIVANFEALAQRVAVEQPGYWPFYASGLCSAKDRGDVQNFWTDRAKGYPGAERELAKTLESIDLCTRLRAAQRSPSAAR